MVDFDSIFYPDTCVIRRSTGEVTPTHEEVFTTLYSGKCGIQLGGGGSTYYRGMSYQYEPVLIIPDATIVIKTNDEIVVNKELRYTVLNAERCLVGGIQGTTIWLKDGESIEAVGGNHTTFGRG